MLNVRCFLFLPLFALLFVTAGCTPPTPNPAPPTPRMADGAIFADTHFTHLPRIFAPNPELGISVELYQLRVPAGTISRNAAFWKHVNEQTLDPARYELLLKNGVRVGVATNDQWSYFRNLIQQYPVVSQASDLVAAESKPVEFTVRKEVPSEDIFYYDAGNHLIGQSFDASENLIAITFQRAPRQEQTMRVVICPVVRSRVKRLEFTAANHGVELKYVAPQRLYDLNLEADVPINSFLVVAPGDEATWRTSIGNNFFTVNGSAEKLENVLLVVPQAIRLTPARLPADASSAPSDLR